MDQEIERKNPYLQLITVYKIPFLLATVSVGIIIICVILIIKSTQTATPIVFSDEASVAGILSSTIHIDIEGAIEHPGLYSLPLGSRVEDAIVTAGGFSDQADLDRVAQTINRASKIVDGGKLYIPSKTEGSEPSIDSGSKKLYDVGTAPSSNNPSSTTEVVNVNLATQSQLEALPGIGPVTAGKIISHRPYQTLEELVSKKALGQSLFEKLKDQLAL